MGMIVGELGFAKYSELFHGDQYEPAILAQMVEKMKMNLSEISDETIVMDARIAALTFTRRKIERYIKRVSSVY